MTCPKDNGSRQVILDLPYPRGHSVNSHVDKDKFDHSSFVLKFPNIDHITEDIVQCTGECLLFKIDVVCAFRNLRVDPVDSLKLGIHWKGQFQILSDSVAYIVAKARIKLHCHIDDYREKFHTMWPIT